MKIKLITKASHRAIISVTNKEGNIVSYYIGGYYVSLDYDDTITHIHYCMFRVIEQMSPAFSQYKIRFADGDHNETYIDNTTTWLKNYRHATIEEIEAYNNYKKS